MVFKIGGYNLTAGYLTQFCSQFLLVRDQMNICSFDAQFADLYGRQTAADNDNGIGA